MSTVACLQALAGRSARLIQTGRIIVFRHPTCKSVPSKGPSNAGAIAAPLLEDSAMAEKKKWSHKVKTVSTYPAKGLFTKDAQTIARAMASKKVSPKGIGSGIRMIQFFINRAGKDLPARRKRVLEKAK